MDKICTIELCEKTVSRRGHCQGHYRADASLRQFSRKDATAPRPAIIKGELAYIPLGIKAKDGYTIVDKDMAWLADKNKFNLSTTGYAIIANGSRRKLHHSILPLQDGLITDHVNRDRLDNRRSNLRRVTFAQNIQNAKGQPNTTSGYKGVTKDSGGKWRAYIKPLGKQLHIGMFENKEDAAKAYDKAAKKYFGEFAFLNIPEQGVTT